MGRWEEMQTSGVRFGFGFCRPRVRTRTGRTAAEKSPYLLQTNTVTVPPLGALLADPHRTGTGGRGGGRPRRGRLRAGCNTPPWL